MIRHMEIKTGKSKAHSVAIFRDARKSTPLLMVPNMFLVQIQAGPIDIRGL